MENLHEENTKNPIKQKLNQNKNASIKFTSFGHLLIFLAVVFTLFIWIVKNFKEYFIISFLFLVAIPVISAIIFFLINQFKKNS